MAGASGQIRPAPPKEKTHPHGGFSASGGHGCGPQDDVQIPPTQLTIGPGEETTLQCGEGGNRNQSGLYFAASFGLPHRVYNSASLFFASFTSS